MPYYRAVGEIAPQRHTQLRQPSGPWPRPASSVDMEATVADGRGERTLASDYRTDTRALRDRPRGTDTEGLWPCLTTAPWGRSRPSGTPSYDNPPGRGPGPRRRLTWRPR